MTSIHQTLSFSEDYSVQTPESLSNFLKQFNKGANLIYWIDPVDAELFINNLDGQEPFEWVVAFSSTLITRYIHLEIHPKERKVIWTPLICFPEYQEILINDYKQPGIRKTLSAFVHDFNNHLTVLLPNLEAAQMFSAPDAKGTKYLAGAMKGMDHLNKYAQLIIELCRSPRDMIRFFKLKNQMDEWLLSLNEKYPGLTITLEGSTDYQVVFYQDFIIKLFDVFIKNIYENQPNDQVKIIVTEHSQTQSNKLPYYTLRRGEFVSIKFVQQSPGPILEIESRMFDPFFTSRQKSKDEGIGLSFAKNILDLSGGTLNYGSSSDGYFFEIVLPKN